MTEITETICRPKQSWMTAPGVSKEPEVKETLDRCIARVFEIPEVYLSVKGRYEIFMYPKHLRRYILERTLDNGQIAGDDCTRINVKNGKRADYGIISQANRNHYWRVDLGQNLKHYRKSGFRTKDEAIFFRDMQLKELKLAFFRYTLSQVSEMSGCDRCTVIHSISTCKNLLETDKSFRAKAKLIFDKISNNQIILP